MGNCRRNHPERRKATGSGAISLSSRASVFCAARDLGEPREVSRPCDTIIVRLARFLVKLHHYQASRRLSTTAQGNYNAGKRGLGLFL